MRADSGADAAVNPRAQDSVLPAEGLQRRRKILIRPQPQREGAALGLHIRASTRHRPEQFEIGLGIGLGREHGAINAERLHCERFSDDALLGKNVAAVQMSVGLGPQPVTMEERRTVALAERHRAELQLRNAGRPKRVAVERRIGAGLRQRRHHIGKGPERPSPHAQHAA